MRRPAPAPSAASDADEVQTLFNELFAQAKAGSAMAPAAPADASQLPAVVVIDGRCLTVEAAAAEYARLTSGQPVESPLPATPEPLAADASPSRAASLAASRSDDDRVVAGARADAVLADDLAELVAMSLRSAADAPEALSSGGAPSRPDTTAVPTGESLPALDPRETSVVAPVEPLTRAHGAGHAPTEQPRREEPEHTSPSPASTAGAGDQAAVDRFLRSDPAALAWLRAAVETNARALLPEQPADLGYFAEAVDVLREHAAGRAMLRAVVARAEHRLQVDATTVQEAAQRPPPPASKPEATRPPSTPTANTRAMRPESRARAKSRPARARVRLSRWSGTGVRRRGARCGRRLDTVWPLHRAKPHVARWREPGDARVNIARRRSAGRVDRHRRGRRGRRRLRDPDGGLGDESSQWASSSRALLRHRAGEPTDTSALALVAARAARWAARSQWAPQRPVSWGPHWGVLGGSGATLGIHVGGSWSCTWRRSPSCTRLRRRRRGRPARGAARRAAPSPDAVAVAVLAGRVGAGVVAVGVVEPGADAAVVLAGSIGVGVVAMTLVLRVTSPSRWPSCSPPRRGRRRRAGEPTDTSTLALVAARAARWAARSQLSGPPQWPVPWGPLWGALGGVVGHPWGPCWGVVERHLEAELVLHPPAPKASRKTCPRRCGPGGTESGRRRGGRRARRPRRGRRRRSGRRRAGRRCGPRARRPHRGWLCRGNPRSAGHLGRRRGGRRARRHALRRVAAGVVELASPTDTSTPALVAARAAPVLHPPRCRIE
jgi:hypothetical protein